MRKIPGQARLGCDEVPSVEIDQRHAPGCLPPKHVELMAEDQEFVLKHAPRPQQQNQRLHQGVENRDHRRPSLPDSLLLVDPSIESISR